MNFFNREVYDFPRISRKLFLGGSLIISVSANLNNSTDLNPSTESSNSTHGGINFSIYSSSTLSFMKLNLKVEFHSDGEKSENFHLF